MQNNRFKQQFISGTIISFLSKYINVFINILLTAILARILEPNEFGVVTVVLVFTTFFQMLSQFGLGAAIIQHKELSKEDISNTFKFTIIIAIILATIFYFFSHAIAFFYTDNIYIPVGKLLSISVLFNSLNIVPIAILSRNKCFKTIGLTSIAANTISGITVIILALIGFSYYSIVIRSIALSILMFFICFSACKIKIRKGFSLQILHKIASYSTFEFLFSFVNYFTRNLDNLLIGKFFGAAQLGYYDKAYKLMLYPVQNLTHVFTPVLHPLLSDYQDNRSKIFSVYKRLSKFLMMLGVPICVVLFFHAKEIILIMYGEKWLYIVPTFRILAVSIIIQIVAATKGAIFKAAGKTNILFISGLINAALMSTGICFGVFVGGKLEYVAIGILVAMCLIFIIGYYLLIVIVLEDSLWNYFTTFKSPFFMGLILIGINLLLSKTLHIESAILNLLVGLFTNSAIWFTCIFVFKESEFIEINKFLNKLTLYIKKPKQQ